MGGSIVNALGVVDFSDLGQCTGSIIAPNAVLTAAHCFQLDGSGLFSTGDFRGTIRYYDPDGGLRTVWDGSTAATWFRLSEFPQDPDFFDSDLAVIVTPFPLLGTDYRDYKRLYADGDNPISSSLRFYGAGIFNTNGNDDNNLRTHALTVEDVQTFHVDTDNGDGIAVCHGDSGGPIIKVASAASQQVELVVGVLSLMDTTFEDDACANTSDFAFDDAQFTRVNGRIPFIETAIGHACTTFTGNANLKYRRCFDVPFIEDLPFEGFGTQNQEVAIASTILRML
jgi:Trypsin